MWLVKKHGTQASETKKKKKTQRLMMRAPAWPYVTTRRAKPKIFSRELSPTLWLPQLASSKNADSIFARTFTLALSL